MTSNRTIVIGVDTHADTHTAAICDRSGRIVATETFTANNAGYRRLLSWARRKGEISAVGIEGTGSYGAGLSRFLLERDLTVIEVNRINRQHRRRRGKSDPADAEAAARAVLAGDATAIPKQRLGGVEAVRVLHLTRRSAIKAKTQASNQIRDLIVTAPDDIRDELRGLTTTARIRRCARWRPGDPLDARSATRRRTPTTRTALVEPRCRSQTTRTADARTARAARAVTARRARSVHQHRSPTRPRRR